jgi:hypothetical protein
MTFCSKHLLSALILSAFPGSTTNHLFYLLISVRDNRNIPVVPFSEMTG